MADITVNAKPMEKLPYDPDVIPDAVKRRAEAVNALYSQGSQQPESVSVPSLESANTGQESAPSSEFTALPVVSTPPQAKETAPPVPTPAETSPPPPSDTGNWEHRYLAMKGRYDASQKIIGEMQEQLTGLGNELLHLQRMPAQPTYQQAPQPPVPSYLTEQDVQNYGNELIDVTQRAAMHAVAPKFAEIERQNAELQKRLATEARRGLDQAVELAVPDYREIDRNPRWHNWLLGVDVLSGRVRQTLLNEAISAAHAPRVISFFRGFLQEERATGHGEPPAFQQATPPRNEPAVSLASLAAPGRARPATGGDAMLPPEKPIYTRAQIAKLYSDKRQGAYVGREAEWARLEQDFFTAQREGRYR